MMKFRQNFQMCLAILIFSCSATTAQNSNPNFEDFQSDDDGIVYEIQAEELVGRRDLSALLDLLDAGGRMKNQLGFSIREVRVFGGAVPGPDTNPNSRIFLQTKTEIDPLAIARMNRLISRSDVPETKQLSGKTYYKVETRKEQLGIYQPDGKTIVINSLDSIENLVRGRKPKQKIMRSKEWKDLDGSIARIGIGKALVDKWRAEYERFQKQDLPSDPIMEMIAPINEGTERVFGGIKIDKELSIRVSIFGKNNEAAKEIESSLQALLQIGKTMLPPLKETSISQIRDENEKQMTTEAFNLLDDLVKSIDFKRIGKEVRITAHADYKTLVKNILPEAVLAAQISARRTQSANNLKQLSLAMHNFHDAQKGFPPAVIIGPKGHRHSWRVAILPYVEQAALYKQYRFDEPWDSPNNTKVMNMMPPVFRHPNDPPSSINTRYLALTGPGTVFEKEGEPAKFQDIRDGSSNTIMFLSGESNVPWTKPEDIAYDPEKNISMKNLPFKNGFNASMFDGSVQFFPQEIDPKTLHLYIQSNDGNIIPREK